MSHARYMPGLGRVWVRTRGGHTVHVIGPDMPAVVDPRCALLGPQSLFENDKENEPV
jgi:hypothetical protein